MEFACIGAVAVSVVYYVAAAAAVDIVSVVADEAVDLLDADTADISCFDADFDDTAAVAAVDIAADIVGNADLEEFADSVVDSAVVEADIAVLAEVRNRDVGPVLDAKITGVYAPVDVPVAGGATCS